MEPTVILARLIQPVKGADDGVIVFMNDGTSRALRGVDEVNAFYRNQLGGRQTATGRYVVPSLDQARMIVASQNAEDAAKVIYFSDYTRTVPSL